MATRTKKERLIDVIKLIPEYGRWSDIVYLLNTTNVNLQSDVSEILYNQLELDEEHMRNGRSVSLLAKWLPSENTSSVQSIRDARQLMSFWKMSPRDYRKRVSALRKYIALLEQKMSANDWNIDYSKIPSQAHRKHIKAFFRHTPDRYKAYLESVKKGEAKINSGTLFTYEIYDQLIGADDNVMAALNEMWDALPDYTNGNNALVVADVSGSMMGRPMSVSVSLALYFAERNRGAFANKFMTFTAKPQLQTVIGTNLAEKMGSIESSAWGMNTNIDAVFNAILDAAVKSKAPQEELPTTIYIISDMQFDECVEGNESNYERAERKFREAGYNLPHVVFWNVRASQGFPADKYDNRVTLISGSSQSTFRYAVEGKNPLELMEEVLTGDRYSKIVI